MVKDKSVYGGMMVDKLFLHLENDEGEGEQISILDYDEWDKIEIGDEYIWERRV